jgi:hypothetical protein
VQKQDEKTLSGSFYLDGLMEERAEAISGSFYAGFCWLLLAYADVC